MTKPKIVAIKHKQPAKKKKQELTALEESVLEEVKKRGEPAEEPGERPQQEGQTDSEQATAASDSAEQKKPKVVEKKDYPLAEAPAEKKTSIVKVQEDIVREMREQAIKDITPVRREIRKPLGVDKPTEEEKLPPELEKKRLVEEAIRMHEEKEREKSFVGRLLKRIGFS